MTDEVTNALLASISSSIQQSLAEQRTDLQRVSAQATAAAERTVGAAVGEAIKRLERTVAELQAANAQGPAVIAVLVITFMVLAAYAVGWTMGHHGVSVMRILDM